MQDLTPKFTLFRSQRLFVFVLALFAGLPALYRAGVKFMLRRNLRLLREGNPEPLFSTYAEDVHFIFPGSSSWAVELHGKEELEQWVRRFMEVGLQLEPQEVLVDGPIWNTSICLRFTDHLTNSDEEVPYTNSGTIFGRLVWGKLTYYEVNEDTEKVAEFDNYLASLA